MSERDWRFEQFHKAPSDLESEPFMPLGSAVVSGWTRWLTFWSKLAAPWVRVQAGQRMRFSAVSREEKIIHELRRLLEKCDDPVRLGALCTMASSVLVRYNGQNAEPSQSAGREDGPTPDALPIVSARNDRILDEKKKEHTATPTVFQDATFLHAVLPFALGLARRHGEPLSLLCVAIDRLSGIHELLGREWADRAVRNVGAHIAAMIRDSDIVARLDDDRIIVVLPRASIPDAWSLAREICETVEMAPELLPELPGLTVSIGVAEFPACAENVFALLDAADHALSMARDQGRNQAVAATTLNHADPVNRARYAG